MHWEDYSTLGSVKVTYVRHNSGIRKRNKRGILVSGIEDEGKISIGWALCKESHHEDVWGDLIEGDVFNAIDGFDIAESRALLNDRMEKYIPEGRNEPVFDLIHDVIPQSIHADMRKFIDRAELYYKDAEFTNVAEYIYNAM